MRGLFAALVFLASVSCSEPPATKIELGGVLGIPGLSQGADHYSFEGKQFTAGRLNITVYEFPSYDALNDAYEKRTHTQIEKGWHLRGFSYFNKNGTCEVDIVDPAAVYQPEYVGHEFLHCVHGDFHPNQGPA